jgi:hypothetical protein
MNRAGSKISVAVLALITSVAFDASAYAAPIGGNAQVAQIDNFDTVPTGTYGDDTRPESLSNGWYATRDGVFIGKPRDSPTDPKPSAPQSVRLTYFTGAGTPHSPQMSHPGEIVKVVLTQPGQVCDLTLLLGQGGILDSTVGTYYARLQADAFAQSSAGIESYSGNSPKILSIDYSASAKFPNHHDVFWEKMKFVNIRPTTDFTALRIGSSTNTWVDDISFDCR